MSDFSFIRHPLARRVYTESIKRRVADLLLQSIAARHAYRVSPQMVAMCTVLADHYEAAASVLQTALYDAMRVYESEGDLPETGVH